MANFFILILLLLFSNVDALQYCDNNCQYGDGYFCVQDDSAAFSVCQNGKRVATMYCSFGLQFDPVQQACNWPSSIQGDQCPCLAPTTRPPPPPTLPTTRRTGPPPPTRPPSSFGLKRVCYFTNWAVYRPGPASYSAANVDPFMCTHIVVAFMQSSKAQISYLETADPDTLATLTKLRDEKNPRLKVLVAIGGWNAGSAPFMDILADTQNFIQRAISFLRQNNLDGLDIDWEYPSGQVAKFTQWMTDMRAAFESEAQATGQSRLLLSAAVSAGASTIDWAYDVPALSKAVDMINLMSYDLNGAWNPTTGLNAAINSSDQFNVQFASGYWIKKGADPEKLIIGIPTYGRTFKLCSPGPGQTGIGSKACGSGNAGPFTQSAGFEAFYESCLKLQCSKGNWTSGWDNAGQAPFMSSGNQWVSYETVKSIAAKVQFVKSQNYGGVMVWALDLDDFGDMCGYGVKSPLMTTLVAMATGQPLPVLSSTPKPTVDPCSPIGGGGGGDSGANPVLDQCDGKCAFDGLYCVPYNASQYYQCANGNRHAIKSCMTGLSFNYLTQICDWPSNNIPLCNCSAGVATSSTPAIVSSSTTTTMVPESTTATVAPTTTTRRRFTWPTTTRHRATSTTTPYSCYYCLSENVADLVLLAKLEDIVYRRPNRDNKMKQN